MAAEWWELAIPAGATLAGVALTLGGQMVNSAIQRRHERRSRFLQDRRDAYALFRSRIRRLRGSLEEIRNLGQKQADLRKELDGTGIDLNQTQSELERLSADTRRMESTLDEAFEAVAEGGLEKNRELLEQISEWVTQNKHQADLAQQKLIEAKQRTVEHRTSNHKIAEQLVLLEERQNAWSEEIEAAVAAVDFLASDDVRLAATALATGLHDLVSDEVFEQLEDRYVAAVRSELRY